MVYWSRSVRFRLFQIGNNTVESGNSSHRSRAQFGSVSQWIFPHTKFVSINLVATAATNRIDRGSYFQGA